jgi:ArsR family transcriptional regulator, arsenate/arsenite/antimonite-responsive transcriptional repressor
VRVKDLSLDAQRLKALGHPVRLGIALRLAAEPETCACDFAEVFEVSQPTVSQHLRVLREAGLVTTRRRGNQICYSLEPGALTAVRGLVSELAAA